MADVRDVYAHKALEQIPRLLSNQDRNPVSPTYGCFHRDYWLDKTSDFPDAVRQFASHALALVYRHPFPGSRYHQQPKIRDWAIAGLDYWARIQHADGSYDEFYPFERGWVGPSAFTMYTSIETYTLLHDELPPDVAQRARDAIRRTAYFVAAGESEEDHLANHHAMACLAVWKAYELLGDAELKAAFGRLWQGFLHYHQPEGWSREYDGVDPGYLSATVSFFAKVYQTNPDPAIRQVIEESVAFSSYFVYPNGSYAGSMGSRNTLHFYAHGYEVMGRELPLAAAMAEKLLVALGEDKLVPPGIISDRYVVYRVPEFLLAYLDYTPRPTELPPLPYERPPFTRYFPGARVFVATTPQQYVLANLAKGGVLKVFDRASGQLVCNDGGLLGTLDSGQVVTSQWIDPAYQCQANDEGWSVAGNLNLVPSNKLFTLSKNLLFRSALLGLGWNAQFSHALKGFIRRTLMLGRRPVPITFRRTLRLGDEALELTDELRTVGEARLASLAVGDEFFVRYVPQSRYFQPQELEVQGHTLAPSQLAALNAGQALTITQRIPVASAPPTSPQIALHEPGDGAALPMGVYDVDYYHGRLSKPQLVYRLRRRTAEVEAALRRYSTGRLQVVVDVGTADGLMLNLLRARLGPLTFLGVDLGLALLRAAPSADGITKSQSDALHLPVRTGSADAVIATAIIEHVPDAAAMLSECARILRAGGLLVMTTPDPMLEQISSAIGLLKEAGHQETFNLAQLQALSEGAGFAVLEARKFMFSPVGFPAEQLIERGMIASGLDLVMANQLIVAYKQG